MKLNALLLDPALLGDEAWGYLERVCRAAARPRRSSSAPAARPSPSGSAACGSGSTTGSPSPVIRRRRWRGSKPSRAAGAAAAQRGRGRTGGRRRAGDPPRPLPGLRRRRGSLDLTRREFELLHLLAEERGQVLEREAIYQRVWGYAMAHGDRSVDVFIRKLRQKLEKRSPGWGYIHTHFGVGYRFDPEHRRGSSRSALEGRPRPSERAAELSSQVVHTSFTAG